MMICQGETVFCNKMTNPLEYIRQRPQLAKQLIGLTLPQLEELIEQAISEAGTA